MMNDLKNPPKHNWFTSIKVKYARWKKVRKEKQDYKKRMGDF